MSGVYNKVPARDEIKIGSKVKVAQKKDYESGEITEGIVARILTSRPDHPRGIKVMLTTGIVGRVQALGGQPVIPLGEPKDASVTRTVMPEELPGPDDLI